MKRSFKLRSYISAVCICAMIITVTVIGFISYAVIRHNSMTQIRKVDSWLVRQQSGNVSYLIEKYESLALELAFDSDLQRALIDYNHQMPGYDENAVRIIASDIFTERYAYADDFTNIILFSMDGHVLGMQEPYDAYADITSYPWYAAAKASRGEILWLEPSMDSRGPDTANTLSIPMVRKIYSAQDHGNVWKHSELALPQGYLLIYLNMDVFTSLMNEDAVRDFKQFLLVDSKRRIIGCTDSEKVGQTVSWASGASDFVDFDGSRYLITTNAVDGSDGWEFVVLTKNEEVMREANQAVQLCFLICTILTVILLILTRLLSSRVNAPVRVLHTFFKKAETEKVAITQESMFEEFNDLYRSFNHMVYKIYTMSDEICRQELLQQELKTTSRDSQLRALQMQINPHFLYNTLDCINWMAQMNHDREVSEMILTLGKFFRSNTQMSGTYTSIEQEIKNIELYITLARLRYGDRLTFSMDVAHELYDLQILKLLLQPLVENAMKYGVDKSSKNGHIQLWIGQEDDSVVVSVTDDGAGMDDGVLGELRRRWDTIDAGPEDIKQVGLYNIMRRLYLCYKDACSFEIFSTPGQGTNIVITYPAVNYVPER